MHGLMSTYNYLISSCAYPGWAWHNVNYGCTSKNRDVKPCLSLLLYLLLAYFRCSGAWLSLAVTSLFCCSYLAFLTTRLQVDYPRTASVIHKLIDIKGLLSLNKQHPSCCLHCGGSILRADTRLRTKFFGRGKQPVILLLIFCFCFPSKIRSIRHPASISFPFLCWGSQTRTVAQTRTARISSVPAPGNTGISGIPGLVVNPAISGIARLGKVGSFQLQI